MSESELKAMAAKMGLDWSSIDWAKIAAIIQLLLDLFKRQPMAAAGDHSDTAACCRLAAQHALQSASVSLEHAAHCCKE